MSRNGSGTYTLPAGNPVVTGTTITSSWANSTMQNIADALTQSVASDGQTPMSGALNMATNKINNVGTPVATTDATTKAYVDAKTDGTASGSFTSLAYSTTLTGGTGIVNLGSGQFYKDASGNVGIGTSSPSSKLTVVGATLINTGGSTPLTIYGTAASFMSIPWGRNASEARLFTSNSTDQYFTGAAAGDSGIQSLGTAKLYFGTEGAAASVFMTNNAERMRIDSSGNLLVGTTGAGARFRVDSAGNTNATQAVIFNNSSVVELLRVRDDGAIFTGTSTSGLAACPYNNTTANAANMVVGTGGDLQRSTSSLKYKTDVQDATYGLAEVLKLRSVTYKGINDGNTVFGGLIAEEVHEAGLTEFVTYADDGSPDALAYGQMVSLAFKAIQEQQAMIEELKAKVAVLENK
jgi:hypothetical protein